LRIRASQLKTASAYSVTFAHGRTMMFYAQRFEANFERHKRWRRTGHAVFLAQHNKEIASSA
jgi:hypothetical protein